MQRDTVITIFDLAHFLGSLSIVAKHLACVQHQSCVIKPVTFGPSWQIITPYIWLHHKKEQFKNVWYFKKGVLS